MSRNFLSVFFLLIFLLPLGVFGFQEISAGTNLVAEVKPISPGAGESVTISLSGYGFDIDASLISWYVNGNFNSKGIGQKTFTFNLGLVGEQTKVEVYVQAEGGQKASKTFIFDPSEIELLWETNTSHPTFYKGKALPSAGAGIKVVALPYIVNRLGQKIDPAKLVYSWKENGVPLATASGLGRNSFYFVANKDKAQIKVGVEARSTADNITATKDLVINLVQPEILFYEKKPLEGVNYGQTLNGEYSLFDQEVTVRAEPYFLPTDNQIFKYLWQIDRAGAQGQSDDPRTITLRKAENVSGSNLINFSAQSEDLIFNNSFIIKYGSGLFRPSN